MGHQMIDRDDLKNTNSENVRRLAKFLGFDPNKEINELIGLVLDEIETKHYKGGWMY